MGVKGSFGIGIDVEDKALQTLLTTIGQLQSLLGGSTMKAAAEAMSNVVAEGAKRARKAVEDTEAGISAAREKAAKKDTETAATSAKAAITAQEQIAAAAERYQKLKDDYTQRGLEATRQAIHEEEQLIKSQRDALNNATINGADKETKAVLAAEVKQTNARLQGLRSVEKEITGARTFSEQLEKNVYGPVTAKTTPGGVISNILFGKGEYKQHLKQTEHEIEATEQKLEESSKAHAASKERAVKAAEDAKRGVISAEAQKEIQIEEAKVQKELEIEQAASQKHIALKQHELKEIEAKHEKSAEKSEGGLVGSTVNSATSALGPLLGMGAVGGVAAGIGALFEKGKAAAERAEEITIGLRTMGMSGEEAEKALKEVKKSAAGVSDELAINKGELESATAAYLKMGGSTDNLKQKQEDIAALAKKSGMDMEMAAKQYAMAGDPEVAKSLAKVGIVLDKNMTAEERAAKIHEKLAGTLEGMKDAANSPLGSFTRLQNTVGNLMGVLGGLIFELLAPLFTILGKVANVLQEYVLPAVKFVAGIMGGLLKTNINIVVSVLEFFVTSLINIWSWIGKVTGITKFLGAAFENVSEFVKQTIAWFTKAKETISNVGSTVLKFLGITNEQTEAEEKNKAAMEKSTEALEKKKKATEDATKAGQAMLDNLKKQHEEELKDQQAAGDDAIAALREIDKRLKNSKLRATGETEQSLLAERQKWLDYSRKQAKENDEQKARDHDLAVESGWAVDNDKKEKHETQVKEKQIKTYSQEVAEFIKHQQDLEESRLQSQSDTLSNLQKYLAAHTSESQRNVDERLAIENANYEKLRAAAGDNAGKLAKLETVHQATLKDIIGKSSDDQIHGQAELSKAIAASRKKFADDAIREIQAKEAENVEAAEGDALKIYAVKKESLEAQLKAAKDNGQETITIEKNITKLDIDEKKRLLAERKRLGQVDREIAYEEQDVRIAAMKDGFAKEAALQQAKYERDLAALRASLEEKSLTSEQYDRKAKILADKNAAETAKRQKAAHAEEIATINEVSGVSKAYDLAQKSINDKFFSPILDNWKGQKTFAMQAIGTITESLLQYGEKWLAQQAAQLATSLINNAIATTTTTTAAAASAAAWAPAAISASIATLGAADAAGTAAYTAAQAAGQAIGHLAQGTDDWRGGLTYVGERGMELINLPAHSQVIPNHHLPNLGQAPLDLSPMVSVLNQIHRAVAPLNNSFQTQRTVVPINDSFRGKFNMSIKTEDRRSA